MEVTTTKNQNNALFFYLLILISVVAILIYTLNFTETIPVQMAAGKSDDSESFDLAIEDFLLRTETPPIELTNEQVEAITELYNDGIEFSNPNDPCQKLKLLGLKKLNKWVYQFKKRGFTVDKIKKILEIGSRQTHSHPSGSNFTRIIHPDGSSIIVDFVNCVIWQIAPADFKF